MSKPNYAVSYGTYYQYLNKPTVDDRLAIHHNPVVDVTIQKFNDSEISVKFNESLRGKHLFVFGETTQNLTELIMTLDAAKRSSVSEITVVLPYFGYSRQDKREGTRGCIGSKAIAHVLESMGIDRVVSLDLHASQIQAYFQVPFEHISGIHIFADVIRNSGIENPLFVTPDAGGTLRTLNFASTFGNSAIATINKRRDQPGVVSWMELTGDVTDRNCILIDDIGDTCGTISKAADLLIEKGARSAYAVLTHPVLTSLWHENLLSSNIQKVFISDTLNINTKMRLAEMFLSDGEKRVAYPALKEMIQIVPCIDLLNEVIHKIARDASISNLVK